MTDWLAQIGGVSSALAGLDMAMPGTFSVEHFSLNSARCFGIPW
jgi:hypothetical protein